MAPLDNGPSVNSGGAKSRVLRDTMVDANRGYPELAKRNPGLAAEIRRRQREVAAKVHRTPPPSMRGKRYGDAR